MATFLPPGAATQIAGRHIPGGLIYVGTRLVGADGSEPDPCLIDPTLPVARGMADIRGALMGYFPAYGTIKPTCRLAYLQWLAEGRRNPGYSLGYPFLFFYGLERALLVDRLDVHRDAIRAELAELLAVYGKSASFRGYVWQLLDFDLLQSSGKPPSPQDMRSAGGIEIAIGWRLADGIAPDPQDLFRLATARLRAGARVIDSCWPEFWEANRQAVETVLADAPGPAAWRGAVSSWVKGASRAHMTLRLANLPEGRLTAPDAAEAPMPALAKIAKAGLDRFKAYFAAISSDPASRGTERTLTLIASKPAGLDAALVAKRIAPWALDDIPARLAELRSDLPALFPDRIDARSLAAAERLLAPHGLHLFPSALAGDIRKVDADTLVRILAGPATGKPTRPKSWPLARLMVKLAACVLHRAPLDAEARNELVTSRILALFPSLPEHLARTLPILLAEAGEANAALWREVRALPDDVRRSVALLASSLAVSAGQSETSSVHAFLEKLYRHLGHDIHQLWTDLHELTLAPAGGTARKAGEVVDLERARQVARDTDKAQRLLGEIFVDEPHPTPPIEAAGAGEGAGFPGLAPRYCRIAALIAFRGEMTRADFEVLAGDLGLLPDGVIDALNEWSIDRFDRPAIEDDGTNILIDASCFSSQAA